MVKRSAQDCLRTLALPVTATGAEVRAAFHRLAKHYHPDLNPSREAHQRFKEVLRAYRVLQYEYGLLTEASHYRICPQCGEYAELLEALDGRAACIPCLLGKTRRTLYLPAPLFVAVRHLSVVVCYGLAAWLLVRHLQTGALHLAFWSLASAVTGFLLLAVTCVAVSAVEPRRVR